MALGIGEDSFYKTLGYGALTKSAELEKQRDQFNQQAKAQKAQSTMTGALGGAVLGAEIGSVVPGIGTAIGAGVGFVGGGLLGHFL